MPAPNAGPAGGVASLLVTEWYGKGLPPSHPPNTPPLRRRPITRKNPAVRGCGRVAGPIGPAALSMNSPIISKRRRNSGADAVVGQYAGVDKGRGGARERAFPEASVMQGPRRQAPTRPMPRAGSPPGPAPQRAPRSPGENCWFRRRSTYARHKGFPHLHRLALQCRQHLFFLGNVAFGFAHVRGDLLP